MNQERYVLERQLGAGGMGEVWLAKDTLLNRPVAIKFLQASNNPHHKELFLSEARTLASLQHPNITTIYDAVFDEKQNRFYIMMEYVEGQSLADMIDESLEPLPLETIISITLGMLRALQYAHNKGFVHRDIKPENVIIKGDSVKLTDFGLAGLVSILAEQNQEYIVGTPPYMSPEQIMGEGIDSRSDLYSLGVTLFEMVTGGRRPFESTAPQDLMAAHVERKPPSVREFAPNTPLMLERIIATLLAKYPEERYDSAQIVLDKFTAIQARLKFSQAHIQLFDPDATPLIGNTDHLARMETIWREVQDTANSRLLVVKGKMGIGKSRLITEFLGTNVVDKGAAIAIGRCSEVGAAYHPYAEILATMFDRGLVKPATIDNQIKYLLDQIPSLAPLLNMKLPEDPAKKARSASGGLWQTLSQRVPATSADSAQAQWQFFATISTILSELGPTVVYLADAAFLDESSAALTRFLVKQELPALIIAEVREEGQPPAWLADFPPEEYSSLELKPLSTELIQQYLAALLEGNIDDAVLRIVEKRSRGNPFQIEEFTRQMIDVGEFYEDENGTWRFQPPPATGSLADKLVSPQLAHALTRRLEKLSQADRDLLVVAALAEAGPEFEFETWVTLLGGEAQRAAAQAALDEALERRLLRQLDNNRYVFRPADVDATLLASLTPAKKRDMHKQAADVLRSQNDQPLSVAYHYEQAGFSNLAAQYLETAGEAAAAANVINQAIDCYKRAADLVETVEAYEALGNLYRQQGDWSNSKAAYKRALELAQNKKNIEQEARILNGLAFTLWWADEYREAAQSASVALKLEGVSTVERATSQSHLGMISWLLGHLVEAENWCLKAVQNLSGGPDQAKLAEAYNRLGLVYFARGKYAEARKVIRQSMELRQQLGQQWGYAYCLANLGQIDAEQGQFEQANQHFETARKLFEEIESNDGLMVVNTEQSRLLITQGKMPEAMLLLNKALHLAQDLNKRTAYGLPDIYLLIAQASLNLNEIERAKSAVHNALKLAEPIDTQKNIATGRAIVAQIHAAQGETLMADGMFKKALALFEEIGNPAGLLHTRLRYAQFLAAQGNTDTATAMEQLTRTEAAKIGLYLG